MAYSINAKDYFNTVLYSGTGSSQSITGVGFQPDWLWQKSRSNTQDSRIFDAVRGGSKVIYSSLNNGEATDAQLITSFDSDGFTMGSSGTNVNDSGTTNVAWNWKANGQGSSNTDGTINSTYTSANTTSGFSIVQYTGTGSAATVGHGLGAVPKMILVKKTSGSESWGVYHEGIGNTKFLQLNTNGTEGTSSGFWNNTTPTSSVFSIKSDGGTNASGQTYIAYVFTEKTGFSKFGKYTGYENTDGPFTYCGFKPGFIMIKRVDSAASWVIFDSKRLGYNVANYQLYANSSTSYGNNVLIDILSNGFKCKTTHADVNSNNSPYIYMAFAEAPLVGSNNIPATAR